MLSDVVGKFADMALQGFSSSIGGGGGGIGDLISSLVGGLFGFARGGTIMPGGSGGIDSQVVAFRKSPNERVDITKPGQQLQGGSAEKVDININVSGANGDQHVIDLVRQGVSAGLDQFNRNVLPGRIAQISEDPYAVG